MAEHDEQQTSSDAEPETANDVPQVDWLLADFIEMINKGAEDASFGITLHVGGLIVSGQLIGGREYFTAFGRQMANSIDVEDGSGVEEFFGRGKDMYGPDGSSNAGPNYIHLKEARVFAPGGNPIPANAGVLWRGRLSSVDAFYFGSLSTPGNK